MRRTWHRSCLWWYVADATEAKDATHRNVQIGPVADPGGDTSAPWPLAAPPGQLTAHDDDPPRIIVALTAPNGCYRWPRPPRCKAHPAIPSPRTCARRQATLEPTRSAVRTTTPCCCGAGSVRRPRHREAGSTIHARHRLRKPADRAAPPREAGTAAATARSVNDHATTVPSRSSRSGSAVAHAGIAQSVPSDTRRGAAASID